MQKHQQAWTFDNTYRSLPAALFQQQAPVAVQAPAMVVFNQALAAELGLHIEQEVAAELAAIFAGNQVPEGAEPLAQAYAGHQFGHFNILGDGRAILLGEHLAPQNNRFDIQLKGSGRTPYSRGGDGRATLSAMLREYLISEAMYHLGIPTSRSLAVVKTGEPVYRERVHAGAVLTRVASSHIRVGTFEYVRQFLSDAELQTFTNYVIQRHYPALSQADNPALALLSAVMERQIDLIVHWMRVGFIHGVMNTDNMSIAGESIDYGPCAFMNIYHPQTVFSSIDTGGRYAYGNQPGIAQWNLAVLAGALLPLIAEETESAVTLARAVIDEFPQRYTAKWLQMMAAKLGIQKITAGDQALIHELLEWMQAEQADYTNTFRVLMTETLPTEGIYTNPSFLAWHTKWQNRLLQSGKPWAECQAWMRQHNPAFIPRNHLVEEALAAASWQNDFSLFHTLLKVWAKPYEEQEEYARFQDLPADVDVAYKTFCGT